MFSDIEEELLEINETENEGKQHHQIINLKKVIQMKN